MKCYIDFTQLSPELTKELNCIVDDIGESYTEFIDELSRLYGDCGYWWDTRLASRNRFLSSSYDNIGKLMLVDKIEKNNPVEVVSDDEYLCKCIKRNLKREESTVKCIAKRPNFLFDYLRKIKYEYRFCKEIECFSKMPKTSLTISEEPFFLIVTPVIYDEIKNGFLEDRYFQGLKEYSDCKVVYALDPVFNSQYEVKQLEHISAQLEDCFIIPQYFDKTDYSEAKNYINWCNQFVANNLSFMGCEVSALALQDVSNSGRDLNHCVRGVLSSLALCRFIKKYEENIKGIIFWYEGQPCSISSVRRIRNQFPNIKTLAYGLSPCIKNHWGLYPSKMQEKSKVVPEYYSVQGVAWVRLMRQFCSNVNLVLAPSFRYKSIFEKNDISEERNGVVLVLPYTIHVAKTFLEMCLAAISKAGFKETIYIKNHPTNSSYTISKYGLNIAELGVDNEIEYLTCSMGDALNGKRMAILTETTSFLEIAKSGIRTVQMVMPGRLCFNCIPDKYDSYFDVCYTMDDLTETFKYLEESNTNDFIDSMIYDCFSPVNKSTVGAFLNCKVIE